MSVTDDQRAHLVAVFEAIDRQDTPAFLDFLTDDATFRFGSASPVTGRDAVGAAVDGFFTSIAGLSHELTGMYADDGVLIVEGMITYTRHDGSTVTLPFADVFEYDGDRISNYKIYADISPLYSG